MFASVSYGEGRTALLEGEFEDAIPALSPRERCMVPNVIPEGLEEHV